MFEMICCECHQSMTNFLWLNCSHHVCLSCAKTQAASQSLKDQGAYSCHYCNQTTLLNTDTLQFLKPTESDRKSRHKTRMGREEQTSQEESYFCVTCMQIVQLGLGDWHKGHQVSLAANCISDVCHLLRFEEERITSYRSELQERKASLLSCCEKWKHSRRFMEQKISGLFELLRTSLEQMEKDLIQKLYKSLNLGDLQNRIDRIFHETQAMDTLLEQLQEVSSQKSCQSIPTTFSLLTKARNTQTHLVPEFGCPETPKFQIDEDGIKRQIEGIHKFICFPSPNDNTASEKLSRWSSRCYETFLKSEVCKAKDNYFDSLKQRVFPGKVQRVVTEERVECVRRSYLGQCFEQRSNRFQNPSHSMSVKEEIERLSKQLKQKSINRKRGQKENKVTITL